MIGRAFSRLGLTARIGIAIVAAIAAIQVFVTLVLVLSPSRFPPFYSASWLSEAVVQIVRDASPGVASQTTAALSSRNVDALSVGVQNAAPDLGAESPRWPLNRVLATIRRGLGGNSKASIEAAEMGPETLPVVPADAFATLPNGPLLAKEDVLMPPSFLIVVDLHDGRWLTIKPSRTAARRQLLLLLGFIFFGTLVVAVTAVLTARTLIAPLSSLVKSADAVGRSREIAETARPTIPELSAIHDAFEAMQRRLKRFVDERTHMLAAISHDLRTPLARLRLQAEFIPGEDLRGNMLANIDAMRDMLTETLNFAVLDASSESPVSFDLASILISLCDEAFDGGAQAKYEGPDHATTCGRRMAVRRMFSNLIDNAVRYGGVARVSLGSRTNHWSVMITDEGPGIPPALFDRAFAPFERLEIFPQS